MTKRLRILVLTQYYDPEPAKTPTSVARQLAGRGHALRVVTGFPNYPDGKVYPGYRQSARFRDVDEAGIQVRRVPLIANHSQNPAARAANYLSFAASSVLGTRFSRGADVTYVYASQPTAGFAAFLWQLLRGTPYVLHVQDLWPESVTSSGILPAWLARMSEGLINRLLRPLYMRAAAVVAIAPTMAVTLRGRGVPPERLHVILNWSADETRHGGARISQLPGCTVTYAGNLGTVQDIETAIDAARMVDGDLPGFRLLLVGSGAREAELRARAEGVGCVEFRPRVPLSRVPEIYARTHFQLVSLRDDPVFHGTIPSKLQASLSAGIPVICTAPGDAAHVVEQSGSGFVTPPGDPDALAATFRVAYTTSAEEHARLARAAREFYLTNMSLERGIGRLEGIIIDALGRSQGDAFSREDYR